VTGGLVGGSGHGHGGIGRAAATSSMVALLRAQATSRVAATVGMSSSFITLHD
jgi:hypothetical protein